MDNTRAKLIELILNTLVPIMRGEDTIGQRCIKEYEATRIADHLIANGVTILVPCGKCRYCNPEASICTVRFDKDGEELAVSPIGFCSDGKARKTEK